MKCKQIFIEKHNGRYFLKLDTWTSDDKTHDEIPGTRSTEPVGSPSITKFAAEAKASILESRWNCTYSHTERL